MSSDSADREEVKIAFLKAAGLGAAERRPLPGDASTRRYERLILPSGASLMLMDAPPLAESPPCDPSWTPAERAAAGWNALARLAAGRVDAFAAIAAHLRGLGLSAPVVEALDAAQGLAVIEDFGEGVFARLIGTGTDEPDLYFTAVDVQARLHDAPPPGVLSVDGFTWPLQIYDATALKAGADLFIDWQPRLNPSIEVGQTARAEWDDLWTDIAARGESGATVFTHRDYHAENLLWLPDRAGPARVGLIDFQDAVVAHPSWDLHSLLQDARRDVAPELEAAALDRYFALRPEIDRDGFLDDYAALAALNEARILGIFARLIVRDGKPRYRPFLPRLWRQLARNLETPALAGLKRWFERHVPTEMRG